ncbi:hypothetical protein NIES4071_79450 [Calothrix sp. NIES-4071]|nr:hypothetical protein NIES4071_79450 [Calothrix sp. NIES-4071]BAZ62215.1 hypothetical protein NIES4105_79380 [Calothrix sp. NIES-4105]
MGYCVHTSLITTFFPPFVCFVPLWFISLRNHKGHCMSQRKRRKRRKVSFRNLCVHSRGYGREPGFLCLLHKVYATKAPNFSSTGFVDTMCRSKPSSFGLMPSAKAINWGKCSIGKPSFFPITFSTSG